MKKESTATGNGFAILAGFFFLVEGMWGLFSNVVFGGLTTNGLHAVIHIILGLLGISVGITTQARGYCVFVGVLLLAAGVLRFIPGSADLMIRLFNMNRNMAIVNIIIGVIALFSPNDSRPNRRAYYE